jgi:hypothetical protein
MKRIIRNGHWVMLVLFWLEIAPGGECKAAEAVLPPQPAVSQVSTEVPRIDPVTGLPILLSAWRDPNWQEPTGALKVVHFDNLPLSEVANLLRKEFKEAFDVLIPKSWEHPLDPSIQIEPGAFSISLQLKNVTASEVFQAINLTLEAENRPARWELKMNGSRPMAVLRVLPQLVTNVGTRPPPEQPKRMVLFVGDLLGDEPKGTTMDELIETVTEVYKQSYGSNPPGQFLRYHKTAQLLVIQGTVDQVDLVQQTLNAIKQKIALARRPRPPVVGK